MAVLSVKSRIVRAPVAFARLEVTVRVTSCPDMPVSGVAERVSSGAGFPSRTTPLVNAMSSIPSPLKSPTTPGPSASAAPKMLNRTGSRSVPFAVPERYRGLSTKRGDIQVTVPVEIAYLYQIIGFTCRTAGGG